MNIKRKILSWCWNFKFVGICDILWSDDLVEIEIGKQGIKVYHRVGSIKRDSYGEERLGIKTVTRLEAERMGYRYCDDCFVMVLPKRVWK